MSSASTATPVPSRSRGQNAEGQSGDERCGNASTSVCGREPVHTSRRFLKNLETAANAIETTMIVATDAERSLIGGLYRRGFSDRRIIRHNRLATDTR